MQHTMAQKLIRAMLFPISQSYHIRYPAVQAVKQMAVPHWKINLPLDKMPKIVSMLYKCFVFTGDGLLLRGGHINDPVT